MTGLIDRKALRAVEEAIGGEGLTPRDKQVIRLYERARKGILRFRPVTKNMPIGTYYVKCPDTPRGEWIIGVLAYGEVGVQVEEKFWHCNVSGQQIFPTRYASIERAA